MKTLHLLLCVALAGVFFACERNTTYVEEIAGPIPCEQCHDDSNVITGKQAQWAESLHGTGEAYLRGTSASCAGCHSGHGFQNMVAAGQSPNQVTQGDPDPTRQDCRACHKIHETYTSDDLELRTTSPVALYAVTGTTWDDGGEGNLCVNCHQPRRVIPAPVNGVISGISEHWGPHHGPQSAMILGKAGAGPVTGSIHGHYGAVENTCVQCHMGDGRNHTMEPVVATCKPCHTDATNLDVDGVQTEIEGLSDQLGAELLRLGLINENSPDGHPTVTSAPELQAYALWNWLYVAHEDKSKGVHNYDYAKDLLEWSISAVDTIPTPTSLARSQSRSASGGSR